MKSPLLSLLLLSLSPAPFAMSAPNSAVDSVAESAHLISKSIKDLVFLNANVDNCTSYGSVIRDKMLSPINSDLQLFQDQLHAHYGKLTESDDNSCKRPSAEELRRNLGMVNQIIGRIDQKLATARSAHAELMGMTGDEAVSRALSSDAYHQNCRPQNPNDPRSTRELQTYFALKQKLVAIRANMQALHVATETLAKNGAKGVCVADAR
jgi:hypothetical protein